MLEYILDWKNLISWVLTGFVTWVWWSLKKRFATKEDVAALENRITSVERVLEALPTAKDMHDLLLAVTELRGDLKGLRGQVDRVQLQVDRVDEFLRNGGRQ